MSLSNHNLFEMINASAGTGRVGTWSGLLLAYGAVWAAIVILVLQWRHIHRRRDLVVLGMAALVALIVSELWGMFLFEPRPVVLHMGVQLSPFPLGGASTPSDEVAVLLAMGFAAFSTKELAVAGFPLLTLGLMTGWGLVYTGEHFPFDVAASMPVAAMSAWLAVNVGVRIPPWLCRWLRLGGGEISPEG